MTATARPASLGAQLSVMAQTDQRDLLPRIGVATLLIWGDSDTRSPLGVARQFQDAIPHAELVVIPGAGHVSNLEQPGAFDDAVRRSAATTRQPASALSNPPRARSTRTRAEGSPSIITALLRLVLSTVTSVVDDAGMRVGC